MDNVREKLGRERCDSAGNNVEEHMKRKREMMGKNSLEGERRLVNIFKRNKKMVRSSGERRMGGRF